MRNAELDTFRWVLPHMTIGVEIASAKAFLAIASSLWICARENFCGISKRFITIFGITIPPRLRSC